MDDHRSFLPYARQHIELDDIEAVVAVLKSDYLTTGPVVEKFEHALTKVTNSNYAVSCSSGTAALHLAALALDLKPGDKIIVPSITFLATANAARYVGAEVVFSDVDPNTGLMTPENFEQAIQRGGSTVKAVFPVHLGGQCSDMPAIADIARRNGIAIVEDASHAIGASYRHGEKSVSVGSCSDSDMVTFSFHPVKTVAMGEGGAITTNSNKYADRLRSFRNHGMSREAKFFSNKELAFDPSGDANPWYYEMQEIGFNYRASDIHCALGLSQLGRLDEKAEKRRALARAYDKALAPLAPLVKPIARMPGDPVWHLYVTLINFEQAGIDRATLMNRLGDAGIGSQVHYIPVHSQPYYRDLYGDIDLSGANRYYARCLSLPLFTGMTDADVGRVVGTIMKSIHS